MILGILGGIWGLLVASLLTLLLGFVLAQGGGEVSPSTQVLLLTIVLGSLSGVVGGVTIRYNVRLGGLILVCGSILTVVSWGTQDGGGSASTTGANMLLTTVFIFGWTIPVLIGGVLALIRGPQAQEESGVQ